MTQAEAIKMLNEIVNGLECNPFKNHLDEDKREIFNLATLLANKILESEL